VNFAAAFYRFSDVYSRRSSKSCNYVGFDSHTRRKNLDPQLLNQFGLEKNDANYLRGACLVVVFKTYIIVVLSTTKNVWQAFSQ
jgi:hypothetical protein